VTLPTSPSAGDVVAVSDYAQTFDTDNLTIDRNGSNIQGAASNLTLNAEGLAMTFVYVDGTKGWIVTGAGREGDITAATFIVATGGTPCAGTTCGDYKIHKFTGPGTFCVSSAGNACGSNKVDYLVVAGAGAGGYDRGGGGGAGGYRESSGTASGSYTISPRGACVTAITVTASPYSIVVGGGGTGASTVCQPNTAGKGNDSTFSTITSTGGGQGQNANVGPPYGGAGGSGGGGSGSGGAGSNAGPGNNPVVNPAQGMDGGDGYDGPAPSSGGGGGGAVGVAKDAGPSSNPAPTNPPSGGGGPGGIGGSSGISGSTVKYAGGGGGGHPNGHSGQYGFGGVNPGGTPGDPQADRYGAGDGQQTPGVSGSNGTDNTGGGGGGHGTPSGAGGNGGSGIVYIRYKFQ